MGLILQYLHTVATRSFQLNFQINTVPVLKWPSRHIAEDKAYKNIKYGINFTNYGIILPLLISASSGNFAVTKELSLSKIKMLV